MDQPGLEDRLHRNWREGVGIRGAQLNLARHGHKLDIETIRLAFVQFSIAEGVTYPPLLPRNADSREASPRGGFQNG